jgi:hypothetical protein
MEIQEKRNGECLIWMRDWAADKKGDHDPDALHGLTYGDLINGSGTRFQRVHGQLSTWGDGQQLLDFEKLLESDVRDRFRRCRDGHRR